MHEHTVQSIRPVGKAQPGLASLRASLLWLIPTLIFLALATHALDVPGIYYDEVLQAVPALTAINGSHTGPIVQVEGSVIHIGTHRFPILILPYLGSTQATAFLVCFILFGASVMTMRLTTIALGAVGVLCSIGFTRRLAGQRAAWAAGLLLAVDPTIIFAARSDNGPTAIMLICKMGALWLLLWWWQSKRALPLAAGCFLLGLGLYDKMNFIWFLGALGASIVVVAPHQLLSRVRATPLRIWTLATALFLAGASAMILYIIASGGGPFRSLGQLGSASTALRVDNRDLIGNLGVRLRTLADLLAGYGLLDFYTTSFGGYQAPYTRWPFPTTLLPPLVVAAAVMWALRLAGRTQRGPEPGAGAFLILVSALTLLASVVTPTNLMYHHVIMVYPFPILLAALLLAAMADLAPASERLWQSRAWRSAASMLLALALIASAGVTGTYYRVLERTGGVGMWSDAINDLAAYLHDDRRSILCMDWGMSLNLMFLSRGELRIEDGWQDFLHNPQPSPAMERLLARGNSVFVFHAPQHAGVLAAEDYDGPRLSFFSTAAAMGLQPHLERVFQQRDGDPIFEVYTVRSADARQAPPDYATRP